MNALASLSVLLAPMRTCCPMNAPRRVGSRLQPHRPILREDIRLDDVVDADVDDDPARVVAILVGVASMNTAVVAPFDVDDTREAFKPATARS